MAGRKKEPWTPTIRFVNEPDIPKIWQVLLDIYGEQVGEKFTVTVREKTPEEWEAFCKEKARKEAEAAAQGTAST